MCIHSRAAADAVSGHRAGADRYWDHIGIQAVAFQDKKEGAKHPVRKSVGSSQQGSGLQPAARHTAGSLLAIKSVWSVVVPATPSREPSQPEPASGSPSKLELGSQSQWADASRSQPGRQHPAFVCVVVALLSDNIPDFAVPRQCAFLFLGGGAPFYFDEAAIVTWECIHAYIYIYIYVHLCVYIYIYIGGNLSFYGNV